MSLSSTGAAFLAACLFASPALAADTGQVPPDVPDHIRSWFKSVRGLNGIPCCDIAAGHRTTWERHQGRRLRGPDPREMGSGAPEAVI